VVYIRSRKRKTGTFHDVVITRGVTPIPCGSGKKGYEEAQELAVKIRKMQRHQRAGLPLPRFALWTVGKLRENDLADAKRRGLKTALPQFQGKQSRRESHWNNLEAFFGKDAPLDAITQTRIRAYLEKRRWSVGAIRDLWSVLRPALAFARGHEESGFAGDPFKGLRKPKEKARKGIALPLRTALKLLRSLATADPELGAYAALLFWTASRLREEGRVDDGQLIFPPYKRGEERRFQVKGKIARLLRQPRAFSYRRWYAAAAGIPGVPSAFRPHDLRHTRLTLEGRRPGASIESLMVLGGWKDPAMAARYLHPDRATGIDAEAILHTRRHTQGRPPIRQVRRKALI